MNFPSGNLCAKYLAGAMTKKAKNSNTKGCAMSDSSQGFIRKA